MLGAKVSCSNIDMKTWSNDSHGCTADGKALWTALALARSNADSINEGFSKHSGLTYDRIHSGRLNARPIDKDLQDCKVLWSRLMYTTANRSQQCNKHCSERLFARSATSSLTLVIPKDKTPRHKSSSHVEQADLVISGMIKSTRFDRVNFPAAQASFLGIWSNGFVENLWRVQCPLGKSWQMSTNFTYQLRELNVRWQQCYNTIGPIVNWVGILFSGRRFHRSI